MSAMMHRAFTWSSLLLAHLRSVVAAVRCPDNLAALDKPNCGLEDPECPLEPPFHAVNISHDGIFRYVETSYCPPYDWSCLQNPKGRRPCARRKTFRMTMYPGVAAGQKISLGLGRPRERSFSKPQGPAADLPGPHVRDVGSPMLGAVGVLLNGVVLNSVATRLSEALPAEDTTEDGHDRWVDAGVAEEWMNDGCHGHLSGGGNYHVHAGRWSREQRSNCGLPVDEEGQHSKLLGWAFDGYGLYGPLDTDGYPVKPEDLDPCGGHSQEEQGGYHYHLTDGYPYSLECYHGCPETSNNARFKDWPCETELVESQPLQAPSRGTRLEL
eukprot:TRINITY_DN105584_c0_g1_i1.p1 TRINITY_DN105584_c0_g1~~TRINITY_DN105584_c0_g1_i1.p1  ORF type:complete len:326 (-),score=50.20 TRINITY_DN105584_c0_g1_i1:31-1008(-)